MSSNEVAYSRYVYIIPGYLCWTRMGQSGPSVHDLDRENKPIPLLPRDLSDIRESFERNKKIRLQQASLLSVTIKGKLVTLSSRGAPMHIKNGLRHSMCFRFLDEEAASRFHREVLAEMRREYLRTDLFTAAFQTELNLSIRRAIDQGDACQSPLPLI